MGQSCNAWDSGWDNVSKKSLKALAQAAYSLGQRVGQVRDNEHLSVPRAVGQDGADGTAGELVPPSQALGIGTVGQPTPIVPLDQLASLVESAFPGSSFIGIKPKGWLPEC